MSHTCPDRLIFLGQNLDNMLADEINAYLFLLDDSGESDIHLYMECSRGSLAAGLTVYDTMQLMKADITTFCQGEASAITALMLSGGTRGKRFIHPAARITLLSVMPRFEGYPRGDARQVDEIYEITESLAFLLARTTGRPQAQVQADLETGLSLTAEEAIAYGIADHIASYPPEAGCRSASDLATA